MVEKKNNSRWFFRVLGLLFIIFMGLYIALESGYYETKVSKKTELTNMQIEEFEKDIKEGREVDIKDYLEDNAKDYSSTFSKIGTNIAKGTEKFMTSGINDMFKFIAKLFT